MLAAVVVAVGVRVAVQVMPPSVVVKFERAALGASRSAVVKPVTASEKEKVTVAVSPMRRAVSLMVMMGGVRLEGTREVVMNHPRGAPLGSFVSAMK